MVDAKPVGDRVYLIDDNLYDIPESGSVYLLTGARNALIDTGPATSAEAVLTGIRQLGFQHTDIDYVIITHIHLDHSGGAGNLLKYLTRAKVLAHYKALKHLIDPSKLIASAVAAQGESTLTRNGPVLPVQADKLAPVHDGDIIELDDHQALTLIEAPGHAPHELCILESRNQGLFVGDAVGHFVDGTDVMIPVTPPPSFDMEQYVQTLNRLMKFQASRIYFAHAGTTLQAREQLAAAAEKLTERHAVITRAAAENKLDTAAEMLTEHICAELSLLKTTRKALYDFWTSVDIPMSAAAHVQYYRKKQGL